MNVVTRLSQLKTKVKAECLNGILIIANYSKSPLVSPELGVGVLKSGILRYYSTPNYSNYLNNGILFILFLVWC